MMEYSDERGLKTAQWFPNEILRDEDINEIGKMTYKNFTDMLSSLTTQKTSNEVISGLTLVVSTGLTCELNAGVAVSFDGTYFNGITNWGFYASPGKAFSVVVSKDTPVAFNTGDSSNPRIDIVEIRPVTLPYNTKPRNFKDPVTGLVTTANVNTLLEYGFEFQIVEGTPAASPVAVSSTAGWIKVAEVYVDTGVTILTQDDIKDSRDSGLWVTDTSNTLRPHEEHSLSEELVHGVQTTTSGVLATNSDVLIPTEQAVRTYVKRKTNTIPKIVKRARDLVVNNWRVKHASELNPWQSVTWSAELGLFCAVASSGTNRVMTSPDGINWTARAAAEANGWRSVTWSAELGLFCAVSSIGTNRVMTSPDGITWTARTASEANQWLSVTWSPELGIFCAVAYDGTNRVMTSPNGINWTAQAASEANGWESVTWSAELGLFCALASYGTNRVMTSLDGITWTAQAAAEANTWQSVTWSPELGIFCAVAYDGTNRVMTSPDGITWTARAVPAEANLWESVTWSPELGLFCAVATFGTNRVMTSPDGITWTAQAAAEASTWQSVTWSPELGIFCAVSYTGTNRVMTTIKLEECL